MTKQKIRHEYENRLGYPRAFVVHPRVCVRTCRNKNKTMSMSSLGTVPKIFEFTELTSLINCLHVAAFTARNNWIAPREISAAKH